MAGGWIKVTKGLWDHPKVVRTASALKADKARTLGAFVRLWSIADEHTIDGRLDGYTAADVDAAVGIDGFAAAAAAAGWLVIEAQAVVIPRFEEHNGQGAKRRAQEADRKSSVRKTSASDADTKRPRSDQIRTEQIDSSIDRRDRPTEGGASDADKYRTRPVDHALWDRCLPNFQRAADIARNGSSRPLSPRDKETIIRCVLAATRYLPGGELDAILSRVKEALRRGEKKNPVAYMRGAFIAAFHDTAQPIDFHRAIGAFEIPPERLKPPTPPATVERVNGHMAKKPKPANALEVA